MINDSTRDVHVHIPGRVIFFFSVTFDPSGGGGCTVLPSSINNRNECQPDVAAWDRKWEHPVDGHRPIHPNVNIGQTPRPERERERGRWGGLAGCQILPLPLRNFAQVHLVCARLAKLPLVPPPSTFIPFFNPSTFLQVPVLLTIF